VIERFARAAPYGVLLALAAVLYAIAGRIEYIASGDRIGPAFWPRAILGLLGAVCAYEVIKSLLSAGAQSAGGMLQNLMESAAQSADAGGEPVRPSYWRLALGIGATLAYVGLVDKLGFFLATAAYLAGFTAVGGYRRWGVTLACGVAGSLAMVLVFMKVVYVSLPLGAGPFRAMSIGLLHLLGVR
jgi:putative tricarboxylic transport membrane protein